MPTTLQPYSALIILSPACLGGEEKNQDRAGWYSRDLVAALADGVTASPYASTGAELMVKGSPVLFKGDAKERLGVLCDLLHALRDQAQHDGIDTPPAANPALRKILEEVAREKLAVSHQTTLVAICLRPTKGAVVVDGIFCGDSAFFAFAPEGNLLTSSMGLPANTAQKEGHQAWLPGIARPDVVEFGPGDEVLARVIGDASQHPDLARETGIPKGSAGNWLVCLPLDRCRDEADSSIQPGKSPRHTMLRPGDLLLVPRYLVSFSGNPGPRRYCRVQYSRNIRTAAGASCPVSDASFACKGAATAVLPDHFPGGRWTAFHERFERDVHFVLASDGFYGCFRHSRELWAWLEDHQEVLQEESGRLKAMQDLHRRLADTSGDDDISFVWVRPNPSPECDPGDSTIGKGLGHAG
jgi:hypothetical protein